ncbi:Hint domain-containing protein [Epibacterium ulvae]|uniref:Hint domain-containing protein n=1 Tax=Epibacterium ulvae TaxID=1156985 RepID=UPI00248FB61D|nr:Hint domain-containing protein [Epibacterium ulvae]
MRCPTVNSDHASYQSLLAYPAEDLCVEYGANMGEGLGILDNLVLDDAYVLRDTASPKRLSLQVHPNGCFHVHQDSELGTPGSAIHLDCTLTLQADTSAEIDGFVMVQVSSQGLISGLFFLPQAPLRADTTYSLIRANRSQARQQLAQMASVSFTRDTHITRATGAQVKIQDLKVGDRVLTRDDGAQEIRWIGHTTARATGTMAPILIRAGALNNFNDLIVSPDHRLMVYQRNDALGTGCSELLIRAKDLVNGDSVVVQQGGFVDYFQILFDRHHIIYAEGIAAESLLIDASTQAVLPQNIAPHLSSSLKHTHREEHGLDVARSLLERPNAVDMLRRASIG